MRDARAKSNQSFPQHPSFIMSHCMQRILDQFTSKLNVLKQLLDLTSKHISEHDLTEAQLLQAKLAEDMFDLKRQIQIATDTAKLSVARLADGLDEAPRHEDNEQTIEELQTRLDQTIAYIDSFKESDAFDGFETRRITLPFAKGLYMDGIDYLHQFAIPNFYFHVVTAYDIMRQQGVPVGKRNFLGHINMKSID